KVNIRDLVPHPIAHDFRIGNLPSPREFEKLVGYGSRSGVSLLHHSLNPLRVVVTRPYLRRQEMFQGLDSRLFGIRIKEDVVFRRLAVDTLDGQRETAE